MADSFKYNPKSSEYSAMMHLEVSETTTTKEVYYSAYSTEQRMHQSFNYTVQNHTKTSKPKKSKAQSNPFDNDVFKTPPSVKTTFVVKEVEPTNKIKQLFSVFLEAGKSVKEKLKKFFRIQRKRN